MQRQYIIRLDPDLENGVEAMARDSGKPAAVVIRDIVKHDLYAPQQPVPQPAARPAPVPSGPGKLPAAVVERIGRLREDRDQLKEWLLEERVKLWLPKLVAVSSSAVAIFSHNGYLAYACCWSWIATVVVDALWVGRESRCQVMALTVSQLWDLLGAVPELYEAQCEVLPPDAAARAVLAIVDERRKRVGESGMKELGFEFWKSGKV